MTGTKTNERPGTRAQVRYLRMSASKARVVLDLIRGKSVIEANQILQFSERLAATEIQKVLRSAVANAQHNDDQQVEELFVSACYADEGPTIKRFRPRARGRAGRINKQTCHVTVIVSRMDDELLDRLRDQAAGRASSRGGADRRARVAKSRGEEAPAEETPTDEVPTDEATGYGETVEEMVDQAETEADAEVTVPDADDSDADQAAADVESTEQDSDADGEVNAEDASPYGDGSHALIDGDPDQMPEGFEIKGNDDSKLYHVPGSPFYGRTKAEVWFATEEAAEAAGFQKPPSQRDDDEASDETAETETTDEGDA